jgi:hypothetical protein
VLANSGKQPMTARRVSAYRRRCKVCSHDEKWRIELLKASGAGSEALSRKFGVSADSIDRHWRSHVDDQAKVGHLAGIANLEKLAEKAATEGESVLDYLRVCRNTLLTQLSVTALAGDARTIGYLTGQLVHVLETIGKISGELGDMASKVTVNNINNISNVAILSEHPAFARLQATLLRALAGFPDARGAVVAALRQLDDANAPAATHAKTIDHLPAMEGGGHVAA